MRREEMLDHLARYAKGEDTGFSVEFEDIDWGGEWAQEIVIKAGQSEMFRGRDKCEPEDAIFCRHFDWIKQQLLNAYELGRVHAIIDYRKAINK